MMIVVLDIFGHVFNLRGQVLFFVMGMVMITLDFVYFFLDLVHLLPGSLDLVLGCLKNVYLFLLHHEGGFEECDLY